MSLRCLLFSSDQGAAQLVSQALADLRIDAEHCPDAVTATERVTSQLFQIVIIDWDDQPAAALLLNTARTRKAFERALTLAMVSDDANVPKALQAGANSTLRKPILINQVRDTLATARDLLRAKLEQSAATIHAPSAKPASASAAAALPEKQNPLRAGEFLQSSGPAPGAQFITESSGDKPLEHAEPAAQIDPLKDLEPMAGALQTNDKTQPVPVPAPDQPRGLAWYLKARTGPAVPPPATVPEPPPANTELLSYDQTPAHVGAPSSAGTSAMGASVPNPPVAELAVGQPTGRHKQHEQETEAQLFAYIAGEQVDNPQQAPRPEFSLSRSRLAGTLLFFVGVCAVIAYWKLPQSVWKPQLQRISTSVIGAGHTWLNPQPVTPPQAPSTHENFGHAGDEYKLPVAETIPDATTDPSQIHVLPVIDPTVKQPNAANGNANQASGPDAPAAPNAVDQQAVATAQGNVQPPATPVTASPTGSAIQPPASSAPAQPTNSTLSSVPRGAASVPTTPQRNVRPYYTAVNAGIPSSLKSQMASSTPEASGNKPAEAASPSIEPVNLPEADVRSLLLQQPAPAYPESAKGRSGTVVLQILVGRDGTVQDAKFLQGSLVFAHAAIDAVKQWRFQPYTMNGRAVSTVSLLTLNFKPAL